MDKLKTYKLLFWCSLVLMVSFIIIQICDYITKHSIDPGGWVGMAAMAIAVSSQLKMIKDIKKDK